MSRSFVARLTSKTSAQTGYVSIYAQDATAPSRTEKPKLLKAIGNLTTSISALRFNHDSQLLAMANNSNKDQMRLVRLAPTLSEPLTIF